MAPSLGLKGGGGMQFFKFSRAPKQNCAHYPPPPKYFLTNWGPLPCRRLDQYLCLLYFLSTSPLSIYDLLYVSLLLYLLYFVSTPSPSPSLSTSFFYYLSASISSGGSRGGGVGPLPWEKKRDKTSSFNFLGGRWPPPLALKGGGGQFFKFSGRAIFQIFEGPKTKLCSLPPPLNIFSRIGPPPLPPAGSAPVYVSIFSFYFLSIRLSLYDLLLLLSLSLSLTLSSFISTQYLCLIYFLSTSPLSIYDLFVSLLLFLFIFLDTPSPSLSTSFFYYLSASISSGGSRGGGGVGPLPWEKKRDKTSSFNFLGGRWPPPLALKGGGGGGVRLFKFARAPKQNCAHYPPPLNIFSRIGPPPLPPAGSAPVYVSIFSFYFLSIHLSLYDFLLFPLSLSIFFYFHSISLSYLFPLYISPLYIRSLRLSLALSYLFSLDTPSPSLSTSFFYYLSASISSGGSRGGGRAPPLGKKNVIKQVHLTF